MRQTEQKKTQTLQEVNRLEHETVAKLHIRYLKVFGEASRSNHKQFLVRRIAWRLQAIASGDLSERARERARLLAEDAELRLTAPAGYFEGRRTRRDSRLPPPGTVLKRKFQDQAISVEVLEKGFQYDGWCTGRSAQSRVRSPAHNGTDLRSLPVRCGNPRVAHKLALIAQVVGVVTSLA